MIVTPPPARTVDDWRSTRRGLGDHDGDGGRPHITVLVTIPWLSVAAAVALGVLGAAGVLAVAVLIARVL